MSAQRVRYTITWLEMAARPGPPPPLPAAARVALLAAENPPVEWFLYLYRSVGGPWAWTDWLERSPAEQAAYVGDLEITLHTMMLEGWPGGFFLLDTRVPGPAGTARASSG